MERWELPATRNTCRHSYVYSSLLNFKKSNKDDDKGKRRQIYNAMPFVSHYFSNARLFRKRCLSQANSGFYTFTCRISEILHIFHFYFYYSTSHNFDRSYRFLAIKIENLCVCTYVFFIVIYDISYYNLLVPFE